LKGEAPCSASAQTVLVGAGVDFADSAFWVALETREEVLMMKLEVDMVEWPVVVKVEVTVASADDIGAVEKVLSKLMVDVPENTMLGSPVE